MKNYVFLLSILFLFGFISMASVSALNVIVHVPEKYTDVHAGERFYFEIEIKYPENPSRKDLILKYEILKDNKIISKSKVLRAVETQASFIDFIVIPESAENGLHVIKIEVADNENLSEESSASASFQVVSSDSDKIKKYFFIILSVIVLVGMLVIVVVIRSRKK